MQFYLKFLILGSERWLLVNLIKTKLPISWGSIGIEDEKEPNIKFEVQNEFYDNNERERIHIDDHVLHYNYTNG